jgi:hypothetical protein
MPKQRHWVNRGEGGECVFITTTVLDFVHAFQRDEQHVLAAVISRDRDQFGEKLGVKVRYIHWNAVHAGYVAAPTAYPWSSAMTWEEGAWNDEVGLPLKPKDLSYVDGNNWFHERLEANDKGL